MKISHLRTEYKRETLDESSVAADPFRQFDLWFATALKAELPEPNAMTLATLGADLRPSARIVLLKEFDERGFVFYTNYRSRKGLDLAVHRAAALLFFWPELERQVRIEGTATEVDPAESVAYFAVRPRASQLGAWASPQSEPIAGRRALEERFAAAEKEFVGAGEVPRPPHWGGYRLAVDVAEFWQGRASRLHDRIRYRRGDADRGTWIVDRLAP